MLFSLAFRISLQSVLIPFLVCLVMGHGSECSYV